MHAQENNYKTCLSFRTKHRLGLDNGHIVLGFK